MPQYADPEIWATIGNLAENFPATGDTVLMTDVRNLPGSLMPGIGTMPANYPIRFYFPASVLPLVRGLVAGNTIKMFAAIVPDYGAEWDRNNYQPFWVCKGLIETVP